MGRRNIERELYWRGVIGEQQTSGVSISAFCRTRKIRPSAFYAWRRKLAQRQQEPPDQQAAKFIPVEIPTPGRAAVPGCFEVVLAGGCRLLVPPRFDACALRDLLGVLEGRVSEDRVSKEWALEDRPC